MTKARKGASHPALKARVATDTIPCQCDDDMIRGLEDTDQLLHLIDEAGILVLVISLKGRILRMNRAMELALGMKQAEAEGRDWFEQFVPRKLRGELRRSCLEDAGNLRAIGNVVPLIKPGGTERQIEWFHSDLSDSDGARYAILCMGRDVTDLKNVRQALLASEERNRGVLETAVNAIITISERGIIESVNPSTERMFGYTKEEMLGNNISMLMPSPYKEQHDGYLTHYKKTGERKIIGIGRETAAQRKDGSVFPVDLSVGEVWLPTGRLFTGIIRDISDRKRLEQEMLEISEQEQQRIGQDIHDDLCQQLAAISCLVQASQQRVKQSNAREAENLSEVVKLVSQANTRAREMSRGLVPVVLEAGGLMAALGELVSSTEKVFRTTCRFRSDPPVYVDDNTTAVQLYRIAQEAVGNAIKHSRANRIEITLSKHNDKFILTVSDNGIGITDHAPGKGTGMGLLTMTHRSKMLGGRLHIAPGAHGGTIVTCEAPLHAPQAEPTLKS
jgi:two-component system sensor kinase FixL